MVESLDWNIILPAIITILPNCLWMIFIVSLAWIFRKNLSHLFNRLTKFGAFGVQAEFGQARDRLVDAIRDYAKGVEPNIDTEQLNKVIKRAENIRHLLSGARILWVDDLPLSNANIHRFLNDFGVVIDNATDTNGALAAFRWSASAYDVVITDMRRQEEDKAGLELINALEEFNVTKKVIVFISKLKPRDEIDNEELAIIAKARAITDQVDELLHYIFDVIERER